MRKIRSWHFIISGGIGGLVGFLLMDSNPAQFETSFFGRIVALAWYFSGFGLAVGAALGMTEGVVKEDSKRLYFGMLIGALLGFLGGFLGGGVGQAVYGLLPVHNMKSPPNDIAIALDSSGSMNSGFWIFRQGNDTDGKRKTASIKLIQQLSPLDRVTVIDFDSEARVLLGLTQLNSKRAVKAAVRAVKRVDDSGGTNLDAGLLAGIKALTETSQIQKNSIVRVERNQHLIFLTDGVGEYTPRTAQYARDKGVMVYAIGLGLEVDSDLLRSIAHTPDHYFHVENADDLVQTFQDIFSRNISMVTRDDSASGGFFMGLLRYFLRILSWLIVGLCIGFGQGVRENTREDLTACSIGGLIGGFLGGALFDPISMGLGSTNGAMGRFLGNLVVGACIGGAMRLVQRKMVDDVGTQRTMLLKVLPTNPGLVVINTAEQEEGSSEGKTGLVDIIRKTGNKLRIRFGMEKDRTDIGDRLNED